MRRLPLALLLVAVAVPIGASAAGSDREAGLVGVPGRVSIRVPPSWHVLHGWLSDVTDPAPRLAVASFPVRLSRQTCQCGFPNVIHFPRDGAFVFVWEYLHPSRRMLAAAPRRPSAFRLAGAKPQRFTCQGPSDGFNFTDENRYFQVEVYLGPAVSPVTRGRTLRILHSLRAWPRG
jgi:hypothetical protein